MDLLKIATDWARAEIFSTAFFIGFGIACLVAALGFHRLGQTDLARAYVPSTIVAGVLLLVIGGGLVYTNVTRVTAFEAAYREDPVAFAADELKRAEATLREYRNVVFTAIPWIIVACALVIAFVPGPRWRAGAITAIAMLVVILLVDGNAGARMEGYRGELVGAGAGLSK